MAEPRGLAIRPCRAEDVQALEAVARSPGRSQFHEARFHEQQAGASTYLVAWLAGSPVGNLNLRRCPTDPGLQASLGSVPEINALNAYPQNQGTGTALILEAERLVRAGGGDRIQIGVEVDNVAAKRLYERLGYCDWGGGLLRSSYNVVDEQGTQIEVPEVCHILVKVLEAG